MTKRAPRTQEPLRTRHLFLDTEVYRRAGFNLDNTQFALLASEVDAGRLVLHVCDITLAEVQRQLKETVVEKAVAAKRLSRDFNRIAQITGRPNTTVQDVNGLELADAAWVSFVTKLLGGLNANTIRACDLPAGLIFDRYFAGLPPFDTRSSKEFPDAFVVESLARHCKSKEVSMYVVSGDAALRRAAESHGVLIPLHTIDDILAAATAESETDLAAIVDLVFASPGFDQQLVDAIEANLDSVDFVYYGPLTDATVREATLREIIAVDDYSVAAFDGTKIGIILQAIAVLDVKVRFLDEEELRDRDDDIIPTELERWLHTDARLKVYISVDLATLLFKESELLTRDMVVQAG